MNERIEKKRPTGVVNLNYFEDKFVFNRFTPADRLKDLVDFYWSIHWQLEDEETHIQEVVPHPAVNLTFLKDDSRITGISDKMYSHTLSGHGQLIGIKFCPAGFFPFAEMAHLDLNEMVDNRFDVSSTFDLSPHFESEILAMKNPQDQIKTIEEDVFGTTPDYDENIALLNHIISQIERESAITSVSMLCDRFEMGERKLQRFFAKYVGVSPKWVIRRYRLQKTLGRIEKGETIIWKDLAVELGYYDQSHFIKDFKKFFGKNPVELYEKISKKTAEIKQL